MAEQEVVSIDLKRLKKKFLELLKRLEEDRIRAIGKFLEEEVKPHMTLREFADLIKTPGFSESSLGEYSQVYRKLYKDLPGHCPDMDLTKAKIISQIEDKDAQEKFIEHAEGTPRDRLRKEVKAYKETGKMPEEKEDGKVSLIEIELKFERVILKLLTTIKELNRILIEFNTTDFFKEFKDGTNDKFYKDFEDIEAKFKELLEELSRAKKKVKENVGD